MFTNAFIHASVTQDSSFSVVLMLHVVVVAGFLGMAFLELSDTGPVCALFFQSMCTRLSRIHVPPHGLSGCQSCSRLYVSHTCGNRLLRSSYLAVRA